MTDDEAFVDYGAVFVGELAWEIASEEHRQGLEVGLSYDHCVLCQREYIRLHCPHENTFVLQALEDPRPNTYCSTCGKHMEPEW